VQSWEFVEEVYFAMFFANKKVLEINGTLDYEANEAAPVSYKLEFPIFSEGQVSLGFSTFYSVFTMTGVELGLILAYGVSRYGHQRNVSIK
jgi:hypothetical protein